ncbi:uncharacterized protein CMU_003390 [Cryptosporidium muris RN66]|uniref:Uncharacterized protein n=1 Tax=Cryptosporidium muris (strain RN66) TaxID=441375 RepID=B6AJW8_CRYMR|nr:uncharacterized protein CMU_003390 [Cryptosporidium muris RN66]EEA08509.1 hypothetical protein, conserved [Cryptosporidium muris RN66]|eukprot:XP_002142858.1 hypothetical protein [Cryptosporidium muris RN66]
MGNQLAQLRAERVEDATEVRQWAFSTFPGLEPNLETIFAYHSVDGTGLLDYTLIEKISRHLIMNFGYTDLLLRLTNIDGTLDSRYISEGLALLNVNIRKPMALDDFKNYVVCWLDKLIEIQDSDVENLNTALREKQEEQKTRIMNAVTQWRQRFKTIDDFHVFCEDVRDAKKMELDEVVADVYEMQEKLNEQQLRLLQRQREVEEIYASVQAEEAAIQEALSNAPSATQLMSEEIAKTFKQNVHGDVTQFTYSSDLTPFGAPVSAGASTAFKRNIAKPRKPTRVLGMC